MRRLAVMVLLAGCGKSDSPAPAENRTERTAEIRTFTQPLPKFTSYEWEFQGQRFSVGVPEGWKASHKKVSKQIVLLLGKAKSIEDGPRPGLAEGVELYVTDKEGAAATATLGVVVAPVQDGDTSDFQRSRFCAVMRQMMNFEEDRRVLPGGVTAVRAPGNLRGFITLVEAGDLTYTTKGGFRLFVTAMLAPGAPPENETLLLLAWRGLALGGKPKTPLLASALAGPRPKEATGGIDGVYLKGSSTYVAFHPDGLAADLSSLEESVPLPYDKFSWTRFAIARPERVGWYTIADGKATIRCPGSDPFEVDLKRWRRMDVDLPGPGIVGRWEYHMERDAPGVAHYKHYVIVLNAGGTFEDDMFEHFSASVESGNPTWNPMVDDPSYRHIRLDGIRRNSGKGRGTYAVGRGYLELAFEGGPTARTACCLDGDTLLVNGNPCTKKK